MYVAARVYLCEKGLLMGVAKTGRTSTDCTLTAVMTNFWNPEVGVNVSIKSDSPMVQIQE